MVFFATLYHVTQMSKVFTELKSLPRAFHQDKRDPEKIISDGETFLKQFHTFATNQ